jgi:hypothetical protein
LIYEAVGIEFCYSKDPRYDSDHHVVFLNQPAAIEAPVEGVGFFFCDVVVGVPGGAYAFGEIFLMQGAVDPFSDKQCFVEGRRYWL